MSILFHHHLFFHCFIDLNMIHATAGECLRQSLLNLGAIIIEVPSLISEGHQMTLQVVGGWVRGRGTIKNENTFFGVVQ